jgi:hypothetical protein
VPNTIAADKTIWAKLDMSDTEPVATIVTTEPDDDPDVFYVCIGKVNAYGGIEQYVFGHIPYGGGTQLDHSFLPTNNGDSTFDITTGSVYVGANALESLPSTATNISFATNTHFQIKVDWSSNINAPSVTWEAGTSFGNNATDPLIRYYPILQFGTAGNFSTLVRRQTSDLHVPTYPVPEMSSSGDAAVLVWNGTPASGDPRFEWLIPTADYSVLQLKANGEIGFDYVKVMA